MKFRRLFTACALITLIAACSSVNKQYFRTGSGKKAELINESESSTPKSSKLGRKYDTTVIYLTEEKPKNDLSAELQKAIQEYDAGNYDSACPKFKSMIDTFNPEDNIYYETQFYIAECEIMNNELVKGENILNSLLNEQRIPKSVREKSLVRMGQIYCVKGQFADAEKLFALFKSQFPNSIYTKLANCESLK